MPRPAYIICAQNGVEDKRTGLVSLFNVLERIEIRPLPIVDGPIFLEALRLHVQAVWMMEEGDSPQDEFEHMLLITSTVDDPSMAMPMPFRFVKPFQRFTAYIETHHMFSGPGKLRFESKIRRVGASDWLTQDYIVPVELADQAGDNHQPDSGGEGEVR